MIDPRGPRSGVSTATLVLAAVLLAVGLLTGAPAVAATATAVALAAASLHAAPGTCLGREPYLITRRTTNPEGAPA